MIPKTILITGASGLIGTRLTEMLLERGHTVKHLSRSKKKDTLPTYTWDVKQGKIEPGALHDTDAIIHLAGTGIADKRWTESRKKEIRDSRVLSTTLLATELKRTTHRVTTFISSSAIGYYGFSESETVFKETDSPGNDFLASVVRDWEAEADKIALQNIRTVKIRTGIVLSEQGGALAELVKPIRWFMGAPLGSGNQWLSWIHIDDLCRLFIHALENDQMHGAFNGVTDWVTNKELTQAAARVLKKPLWLPHVPGFALKLMLGEMANLVLLGNKVSAVKTKQTGFAYKFGNLNEALHDLLARS